MSEVEPTLKCVIAWSDKRNLCSLVETALKAKLGADEVRRLGDDSLLAYGSAGPDEIRDWIGGVLDERESAVVLEFEKWSGRGPSVDAEWLMRRGH